MGAIAYNYIKDSKIVIDMLKEEVEFVGCSKSLSSLGVLWLLGLENILGQ